MTALQLLLMILAGVCAFWAASAGIGAPQRLILIVIAIGLVFAAVLKKGTKQQ